MTSHNTPQAVASGELVLPEAGHAAGQSATPIFVAEHLAGPADTHTSATDAVKAASASPYIDGTGDVSSTTVANELGLPTVTRAQHEDLQEVPPEGIVGPARPQDVSTGGLVKQQDTASVSALDPDTHNTWSDPAAVPTNIYEGLEDNDELYEIVRRMDKQLYSVRAFRDGSKRGQFAEEELDLVNSSDEEFSSDRLRSNLERLYLTFVLGAAGAAKHIQRVRSWNEYNRTVVWCTIYFAFWLAHQVGLLLGGVLIVLMVYPPSRQFIFPPAPLSMVSVVSGGLQKPRAGDTVGSKDSLAGGGEAHKGEAVENEARQYVNDIANAVKEAAAAEGKEKTTGDKDTPEHTKAKDPVTDALWLSTRPAMRAIEEFCDNYERVAFALSPVHPYPEHYHRCRLAALIVPIILTTTFVKAEYVARGASFLAGVLFFSQPYMSRAVQYAIRTYPNWRELIKLQNTLLVGIPSNNQLALTLLRIGEMENTPLPPPPSYAPDEEHERPVTPEIEDDLPNVNPDTAIGDLSDNFPDKAADDEDDNSRHHGGKTKKKLDRFVRFVKGSARSSAITVLSADRLKGKTGSPMSKERQGALDKSHFVDGPSVYNCRYNGKKGWLLISTSATTPCISWVRLNHLPDTKRFDPEISIQVDDIIQMKKLSGLGWKSKLVLSDLLDIDLADAVEVTTVDGKKTTFTALPRRDALFNRLLALSHNRWESC